jgi:DNA-binding response OmpR family regulator
MDAQHIPQPGDDSAPLHEVIGRIGPVIHIRAGRVPGAPTPRSTNTAPLGVLIVSDRALWARRLHDAIREAGAACTIVRTLADACISLGVEPVSSGSDGDVAHTQHATRTRPPNTSRSCAATWPIDIVISDCALPDGDAMPLAGLAAQREIPVILAAKRASVDLATCAMQWGMADLVEASGHVKSDLVNRILGAAARSRNLRSGRSEQARRLFRLHHAPAHANLSPARQSPSRTSDLTARPQPEQAVKNATNVSEFKGLIRGELDIEALLRTTLEFVLARSGPTNAAVFLPTTSGDYSLGAYVNYDCPKDTCDVLLDHLANAVAPRFESAAPNAIGGMTHLTDLDALNEFLGDDADWLKGSHVVGFPCSHDGEVLAIFMLFRDQRSPFNQALLEQVKTVGELFAAQLARVIHIHHRHLPKNKWGMIGDPPAETDDYGDMAA